MCVPVGEGAQGEVVELPFSQAEHRPPDRVPLYPVLDREADLVRAPTRHHEPLEFAPYGSGGGRARASSTRERTPSLR